MSSMKWRIGSAMGREMSDKVYRIFATADIGEKAIRKLEERGYEVEVYADFSGPPRELIIEKVSSGIDGLISMLRDPVDREVIGAGSGALKVIAQNAVGVDNIDVETASELRIPVTNTADVLTEATAEFAFFMLGNLSRKLYQSERLVREGKWRGWHPYHPFLGNEVTGKTIAVIGVGKIGRAFAAKCVGFDLDVLGVDPNPSEEFSRGLNKVLDTCYENGLVKKRRSFRYMSFEEALPLADYVTLHVPLVLSGQGTFPTYHLMDERAFRMMKPTAYLINASRGPVVDEEVLVEAPGTRGGTVGRTRTNKVVVLDGGAHLIGRTVPVEITSAGSWVLRGRACATGAAANDGSAREMHGPSAAISRDGRGAVRAGAS